MITRDQIFLKIQDIMGELFEISPEKIKLESRLNEDLDLDSIDAVDLIVKLQEYIEKRVDPAQFKGVRTIADVVSAIELVLIGNPILENEK